jgi:hypothetical protein
MKLDQVVPRKRSAKKSDQVQKATYSQEGLEAGSSAVPPKKISEPERNSARQDDLWSLSTEIANQFAERTMENYNRAFNIALSPPSSQQREPPSQMLPMAPPPSLMTNGVQAITREVLNQLTQQVHHNFEAMNAVARSRSPQDYVGLQIALVKGNYESMMQSAIRIGVIAFQMAVENAGRINRSRSGTLVRP